MGWNYTAIKESEMKIINTLRKKFTVLSDIRDTSDKSVCDAYNAKYRIEMKDRKGYFEDTMIDKKKLDNNMKDTERDFLYVVRQCKKLYIFNITKLLSADSDFEFNWEYRDIRCPSTGTYKNKEVGYLPISQAHFVYDEKTDVLTKQDNNEE